MTKPRVLLLSSRHLFGESMEMILRAEPEVELVGPWDLDEPEICRRLLDLQPSVVVIADDNLHSETAAELTKTIIERSPEVTVIRTGLSENVFRLITTHTLPARGSHFLETIRTCILRSQASDRPEQS
jgi:hypothetical protein